jgi:hypothetical protein
MLGMDQDVGYGKLFASGRLTDAARASIRERVLEMAAKDPFQSVRITAANALRRFVGEAGDQALLAGLREIHAGEPEPLVRAALDHAIEDLDPASAAKRTEASKRVHAGRLRRMLRESSDPASSPWADAHAYIQSAPQRTTDQLLTDYAAFPDPVGDEVRQQNAALKRGEIVSQLSDRLFRGEISDLRRLQDAMTRALAEEPDAYLRGHVAWDLLKEIAERGGRGMRAEIVELFEQRLPSEPDRYARAKMELALTELKAK